MTSGITTDEPSTGSTTETWNSSGTLTTETWGNVSSSSAGGFDHVASDISTTNSYFVTSDLATTEATPTLTVELNYTETLNNDTKFSSTVGVMLSSSWGTVPMTTAGVPPVAVAAAVFMTIFVLVALAGNVCCLIALAQKNLDKTFVLYSFLSNICAIQLCDSILTMPLVVGAAACGMWPYGDFMCQLSAFILNLVNVETMMALTLLALDRMLAVRWPNIYSNMKQLKANLITGYTWLHGTAFTLVIVAGVIPTEYLQDCYLCSVSSDTAHVYLVFFSLFCYILPLLIIISMYVVIVKVAVNEKPTKQNFKAEESYARRLDRRSKLWQEIGRAKIVGALVVLWCLFEGPYLALQTVYLYGNSGYPDTTENVFRNPLKTAFTWMRFCYAWIVPLVVFIGFPEVREELSNTCTCRKSNMVDSGRQEMLVSPRVRTSRASDASSSRPSTLGRSFQVPVLFATPGGLRLQIGNKQRENDVDKAGDFHQGFHADPRTKYDPTKSRYPPPLTPVPQSSDEDTGGSWDIRGAIREDSPEPGEIAQDTAHVSSKSSSDPVDVRSISSSSSFQLSLTSRELKSHRSGGTPRTPNDAPPLSPVFTPRQEETETPPGSIPPSEPNTPR